ncbi:AMP-binding protein [Nocardia alba]|uniref:Fatty-acyl-CoA synthase n=1 Tax=Nocardia alba TaxID=225051 RepID=A0A4R1FSX7_9NOCA|nr:AMP-binding protein [Nocardia alba]TCJ96649.1 fatty-acyl-CoA synthase [Nocardia alba]
MITAHPANSGAAADVNPTYAIRTHARYQPDDIALRYAGGDWTYARLDDRVARLTTLLAAESVDEGDRVAYLGLNSPAFLTTMFAAFRRGAIFVPLNFRLAGPELAAVLERSGATVIVCEQGHREILVSVSEPTSLTTFLLVDDDPQVPPADSVGDRWRPWGSLLAAVEPTQEAPARGFDDTAMIMFTSGTTGRPKGVILTYGNLWWNGINVDARLDTRRGDITHAVAPLFHIGGLNALALRTLVRGGTVVLRRGFDPADFLDDLHEFGVNSLFAVPAMLAALARVPGVFDDPLPALRTVVVAAAPVPPSLIELYAEHGIILQQAWGLTETAPFATHLPAERTAEKLGSAGIPMAHTQVRIIEPGVGDPLPAGVNGEIVVRGPNVTPGYWNDPTATAAAFDAQGWFHSGDIGYLDDDGYLYIVDRLKDMIISGGENIYPAEVERALADLPGLIDVAVVGAEHPEWGETVVAVASAGDGNVLTLDQVRDHAAITLARYKLPTRLLQVTTVPRNASGKLDKLAVRRMVDGAR